MKPQQSFLSRIMSTLENIWGNKGGPAQPLKVVSPKTSDQMAEDQRLLERQNYIRKGATFPEMSPREMAISGDVPQPTPTPVPITSTPEPTAAPGIENVISYLASNIPASSQQTPEQYYPALNDPAFMQGISEADKLRQGLASLLLLQSFNESTLGRANNGGNYFGTLPGGESSGQSSSFNSPSEALNYQLSPAVLGGGANQNMNILDENTPLTPSRVTRLYDSYNPNSPYLNDLLKVLFSQGR